MGQQLEVRIEKIVPNGYGLGFGEHLTVFVPLAVPGDLLRVSIDQLRGRTAFAEILEIIEPAPTRIEPRCPYFGRCGGCNFQQMPYREQLEAKTGIIRDALRRIGGIDFGREIRAIASPREFDYRARAQWHADPRRKKFGYFQRRSKKIIDIGDCPILTPELKTELVRLRRALSRTDLGSEIVRIEAATDLKNVSVFSDEIIEPTRELSFANGEDRYFYNAATFFQGNPFLIDELISAATGGARGEAAFDLYCGIGLFTLPLARRFAKVTGVEADVRAVDFAEKAVVRAGLANVALCRAGVAEFLSENETGPGEIDFILLDPPRAGPEKNVIGAISGLRPAEIAYVSCDPAILARDLGRLTAERYQIDAITAIDLFPQTHHIETVVRLSAG